MQFLKQTFAQHSSGLIFLILYKAIQATILWIFSTGMFTIWLKHSAVEDLALEPHRWVVQLLLEQILRVSPKSLEFGAIALFLYGTITGIEAIGLWFKQSWARWLVLISVGISLPIEAWEIIHHMTGIKWAIFVINMVVFWYVLRRFPNHQH